MSTSSDWFNRLNFRILSNRGFSKILYPLLRAGRNAALFCLGRQRLQPNAATALSAFAIFSHAFGMYAFTDFLYSRFGPSLENPVSALHWFFGAIGLFLLVKPRSPRAFSVLSISMLSASIAKMPTPSNHAILITFCMFGLIASAAYTWIRGRSWTDFMSAFGPVGRALLLTMYFFGVFHKINTGFLNPELSCAVDLWQSMPAPLAWLDGTWWRYTIIYGTLIGEATILIGLLISKTRYAAIILGIIFHSMLALSDYGFYLAFSTLTIALHLLFLSPGAASRITKAETWKILQKRMKTTPARLVLFLWAAEMFSLASLGQFTAMALLWMPWAVWLICLIAKHGREQNNETTVGPPMWSKSLALNAVSIAFFINCAMPFLGLKNAQAMNMFANTTYENGVSTHLILPSTGPFSYMRDTVEILSISGLPAHNDPRDGRYTTFYDLLNQVERNPKNQYTYVRGGTTFKDQTSQTLSSELKELHPKWFRAYFHFHPFNSHSNQLCERGA